MVLAAQIDVLTRTIHPSPDDKVIDRRSINNASEAATVEISRLVIKSYFFEFEFRLDSGESNATQPNSRLIKEE